MRMNKLFADIPNFLKKLTLALLLLVCSWCVWGSDYTWESDKSSGNWNDYDNWDGVWLQYPQSTRYSDTATISRADTSITIPSDITISKTTVNATGVSLSVSENKTFTSPVEVKDSGSLSLVGQGTSSISPLTLGTNSNLSVSNGNVTIGTVNGGENSTINVSGGNVTINTVDASAKTTINVSGGTVTIGSIPQGSSAKINVTGGTVKLTSSLPKDKTFDEIFNISGTGTIDMKDYSGDTSSLIEWAETKGITLANAPAGNYSVSVSPTLNLGTTSTVTVTNDTITFNKLYFDLTLSDSTTIEEYKINGVIYTQDQTETEISFDSYAITKSFTIVLPASMDVGETVTITLKDKAKNPIGSSLTFTYRVNTSIYENGAWNVPPDAQTEQITIRDNLTYSLAGLTSLQLIKIENNVTFDIGDSNLNISKIDTASSGTIKTSGDITIDKTYSAENLKVICKALNNNQSGKFDFTCYSVISNSVTIDDAGGRKSVTALHASSFGDVKFTAGNLSLNLECKEDYTVGNITVNKTGGSATFWGGGWKQANNAKVTVTGTVSGTGSSDTLLFYCPVEFTSAQTFTGIEYFNAVEDAVQNPGSTVTVTLKDDSTFSCQLSPVTKIVAEKKLTISNSGSSSIKTLSVTGDLSITNPADKTISIDTLTANGSVTLSNSNSTADSLKVNSFTASAGDKQVSITGEITIGDTLTLEGLESHPLTITGTGSFVLPSNLSGGNYLSIDDDVKIKAPYKYIPSNSGPVNSANIAAVIANGWIIADPKTFTYKWETSPTDNAWNNSVNWDVGMVPVAGAAVVIPADVTEANWPVISAEIAAGSGKVNGGSLSIGANSGIIFENDTNLSLVADAAGTATSATLSNSGTIVYKDTGRILISNIATNDTTKGTVRYTGSTTTDGTISDFIYYNLEINTPGKWQTTNDITVKNDFTLTAGTMSTEGAVSVTAAMNITSGSISSTGDDGKYTAATISIATGTLSGDFEGTTSITVTGTGSELTGTFTTLDFTIDALQDTTFNNATVKGPLTNNGTLTISTGNSLTIDGAFTQNGTVTIPADQKLSVTGNVTDTSTNTTPWSQTGTLEFSGDAVATFTAYATSERTYPTINVNKVDDSVNPEVNKTLTIKKPLTIKNFTVEKGNVTFEDNVTFTENTTIATTGTIKNQGTITASKAFTISAGQLTSEGDVTVKNALTLKDLEIACADNATVTLQAESISINGSVLPTATNTKSISLKSTNGTISTGSNGAITIGSSTKKFKDITIDASTQDITFGSNVTLNASNKINVKGKDVTFNNYVAGTTLIVDASGKLSISGLEVGTLTISNATSRIFKNGSVTTKNAQGEDETTSVPVRITNSDFTIDNAITLSGHTDFEITGTGKKIILANPGSIIPDTTSTSTSTGYKLSLSAAGGIELNNDLATDDNTLQSVTFKSPVQFNAADKKIYALTTEFTTGSSLSTNTGYKPFQIKNDLLISGGTFTYYNTDFTVSGDLQITTGTATFGNALTVTGSVTNNATLNTQNTTITGNFTDTGTFSGKLIFNGGTADSKFTAKSDTSYNVNLQKTDDRVLKFTNAVKLSTLTTASASTYASSLKFTTGGTLSSASKTEINCPVNLTGTLTANNGVQFNDGANLTAGTNAKISGTVDINTITISDSPLEITGAAAIAASKTLTLKSNLTVGSTGLSNSGTLELTDTSVSITGAYTTTATTAKTVIPADKSLTMNGKFTNNGELDNSGTLILNGDFDDAAGTWTANKNGAIIITGAINTQEFIPSTNTTYPSILIEKDTVQHGVAPAPDVDKSTDTIVNFKTNELKVNSITVKQNGTTNFNTKLTAKTLKDVESGTTSTAGILKFNAGAAITDNPTFYTTGELHFEGYFDAPTVIFGKAGQSLSAANFASFNNVTINTGASVSTTSDFEVKGDWTNNGSFTAVTVSPAPPSSSNITFSGSKNVDAQSNATVTTVSGANTFNTATFTAPILRVTGDNTFSSSASFTTADASIEISGTNSFGTLSFTGAGSTVKFGAAKKQTVTNIVSKGTAAAGIKLTTNATTPNPEYSAVGNPTWWKIELTNQPAVTDFVYTTVEYSDSETDIRHDWGASVLEGAAGSTNNWFYRTFYWFGKTDTSWDTPSNWSYTDTYTAPGCSASPLKTTGFAEIYIKDNDTNILKLETTDGAINISLIEVYVDKTVNFGAQNITTKSITNYGTVKLAGTQTITAAEIKNSSTSTVEYYGKCTNLPMSDNKTATGYKYYNNIAFTGNAEGSGNSEKISGKLKITGTTTIKNASGKALEFSNSDNIFTGNITIGDRSASPNFEAGFVSITASNALTFNGNLLCNQLKVVTPEAVTLNGDIETTCNSTTNELTGIEISTKELEVIGSIKTTKDDGTNKGSIVQFTITGKDADNKYLAVTFAQGNTTVDTNNFTVTNGSVIINKTASTNKIDFNTPVAIGSNLTVTKGVCNLNNSTDNSLNVTEQISTTADSTVEIDGKTSAATVSNAGKITFNKEAVITGNFTNTGTTANAVTNSGTISIGGNLTDTNGKWKEGAGIIKFNGTVDQIFNTNTTTKYNEVQVEKTAGTFTVASALKAGTVTITKMVDSDANNKNTSTFSSTVTADTFNIQEAENTVFSDTVTIGTFNDNPDNDAATNAGDITFSKTGTISSDTLFTTTGTVTFSEGFNFATTTPPVTPCNVTHTAGITQLGTGLECKDAVFTTINITNNPIINCESLTINGNTSITGTASYIKITGNFNTNNTITIAPDIMLDGSFGGDGNATFQNNFYIFSPNASPAAITMGTTTINGDLIFDSPRDISTSGTITANNIVLYRGNIKAGAGSKLVSVNDIILLGPLYKSTNNPAVENHNLPKLVYTRKDFSTIVYMSDDATELTKFDSFSGTYETSSGSTLYAGKNFYANGITFTSSDNLDWYIYLPDIRDTTKGFAEAYNCDVTYSNVYCHNGTANDTADDTTNGTQARLPAYNCTDSGNNEWWLFEDFNITNAYTERDNSIYVEFNHPVRNQHNEITSHIADITNSAGAFSGIYKDADCETPYSATEDVYESKDNVTYYLYLKSPNSWNTDATGTITGPGTSTDRNGINKNVIPYIDYSANVDSFVNVWGKRLEGDAGSKRENVLDHTGPVLYSVRTGQELHSPYNSATGADSQPGYDAHNFIEFRYSEPVNFGDSTGHTATDTTNVFDNSNLASSVWLPANATPSDTTNVRVRDSLGAVTSPLSAETNLTIAGLGTIATGKIHTGSQGADDKYVNSLYRIDEYTLRYSIAGYTEGTTTDRDGNVYKIWKGYIENAKQPDGKVVMTATLNPMVTDCAVAADGTTPLFNKQEKYADSLKVEPEVNKKLQNTSYVDPSIKVYGDWDLSEPVFAPLRRKASEAWENSAPDKAKYYEAVGNTVGAGSTLQKIEFHFFDNTPNFDSNDKAVWFSEKGWVKKNANSTELYESYTYCADIFGGSRQFANNDAAVQTTGGLRFSTISHVNNAFKYAATQTDGTVPDTPFANTTDAIYPGAKAPLFTGSSAIRRPADDPDGLYFGIQLSDVTMALDRSFTVSYDDQVGFITDLAGNRLRSKTIKTIDRTPPSYDFMLAPLNQNELYMVFVKELVTDTEELNYNNNTGIKIPISESFADLMPKCFELFTMTADGSKAPSDLQIDYTQPAKIEYITSNFNNQPFTVIRLRLNKNITLKNVEETFVRLRIPTEYGYSTSQDPLTGLNDSSVTFIQDVIGNYMQEFTAHSLSDFAISSIDPLYAYDQDMEYDGNYIMNGLYEEGSWAVHDWNVNQQNYGTLPANHPFGLVADIISGENNTDCKTKGARLFLSSNPTSESISAQLNKDLNIDLRIWIPELAGNNYKFLAQNNNPAENYSYVDSTLLDSAKSSNRLLFNVPKEIAEKLGSGKQVSFIFGLLDSNNDLIRIYNTPYYDVANDKYNLTLSTAAPLYAVRQLNSNDMLSLDLWSYKTKSITEQRGGVTILNNVINATNGEQVAVKVNMPSEGKLNVMVMTLDGNIVKYLNHGETTSGEHYYSWDGTNIKGNKVARGMYFVRVVGTGIDETRKVMVVK